MFSTERYSQMKEMNSSHALNVVGKLQRKISPGTFG